MTDLPPPSADGLPVAERIRALDALVGRERFVAVCVDLLAGADRTAYVSELGYLTGHRWQPGDPVLDPTVWKDYWVRTWGARGLLHCWDDRATGAVVAGLEDAHYRPAEMCLKVAAKHDVAGAGPGAAVLAGHRLARVRGNAVRTLGVVGDTEHAGTVLAARDDLDEGVRRQAARAYEQMARRLDLPDLHDLSET